MKKNMIYGILFCLLVIPFYAQAQDTLSINRYSSGSVFSFGFGAGMSGIRGTGDNLQNEWGFPGYNASIRYTIFCTKWFGLMTGAEFSTYNSHITMQGAMDWQNANTITTVGQSYAHRLNFGAPLEEGGSTWSELEYVEMLEVPMAICFKAKPRKVGFLATVGVKAGFPMRAKYSYQGTLNHSGFFADYNYLEYGDNHFLSNDSYDAQDIDYNRESWKVVNASAFVELGLLFQLHPRLDMSLDVYGSYGHHDLFGKPQEERAVLGFATESNQLYEQGVMNPYQGLIGTDAVQRANTWNCGVKIALHVNCSNKTDAEREARRLARKAR